MSQNRKRAVIQMLLILAFTSVGALIFRVNAQANYSKASKAMEAGDYEQASLLFSKCTIYLDSAEKASQAQQYLQAITLYDAGNFDEAHKLFLSLGDFGQSAEFLSKIEETFEKNKKEQQYNEACKYMLQNKYPRAFLLFKELGDYEDSESLARECEEKWRLHLACTLSAGTRCSVGITPDNMVLLATNDPFLGKADMLNWNDIVSISVRGEIVIGLRSNGTVVTAKRLKDDSYDSYINTDEWTDIVAVSAGEQYVVGLRNDGTVKAASLLQPDGYGETDVTSWKNIVAIDTAWQLTVGLDQSGNVYATGCHAEELQNEIEISKTNENENARWTDVVAISVGGSGDIYRGKGHIVGLTKDGRVVAVGDNDFGQCDVDEWEGEDIIAVSAGNYHTVALTKGGRVLTTQRKDCHFDGVDFSDAVDQIAMWEDIVAISAGYGYTLGLKSDGTVVAAGYKNQGQADVQEWRITSSIDSGDLIRSKR